MSEQWEERYYFGYEVALSCVNWVKQSKVQSGDIVVCRRALGHIGFKEAKTFLWLYIENIHPIPYRSLSELLAQDTIIYDKRRYCIPFHRLQQVYPSINLERVADTNDPYQPFYQLDLDNYKFLIKNETLQWSGLIFDKVTGLYL